MSHVMDAFAIYAVTALGGRHVIPPSFDSTTLLETIARERVSCTSMASHVVSGALPTFQDPRPLRRIAGSCVRKSLESEVPGMESWLTEDLSSPAQVPLVTAHPGGKTFDLVGGPGRLCVGGGTS